MAISASFAPLDEPAERLAGRALGRDVEQVELAGVEALDGPLAVAVGRGQRRGLEADRIGAADLVVHQRDQRRDDQRRPSRTSAGSW